VTRSSDGGLTWGTPVMVVRYRGTCTIGAEFEEGKIATDNNPGSPTYGDSWITAQYVECKIATACRYPIAESHSNDGGATWTRPQIISGPNAQYCTAPPAAPRCDNDAPPAGV